MGVKREYRDKYVVCFPSARWMDSIFRFLKLPTLKSRKKKSKAKKKKKHLF